MPMLVALQKRTYHPLQNRMTYKNCEWLHAPARSEASRCSVHASKQT
jgi:hypothetical protein